MAFAGRVGDARAIGTLIFFGYFNHPEQEGNWVGLLITVTRSHRSSQSKLCYIDNPLLPGGFL